MSVKDGGGREGAEEEAQKEAGWLLVFAFLKASIYLIWQAFVLVCGSVKENHSPQGWLFEHWVPTW